MRSLGMFWLRAALALGAVGLLPTIGHADFMVDDNRRCSAGGETWTTSDTVPGGNLSLSDVTLTITGSPQYKASNCYGDFDTDNQAPETETGAVNDVFASAPGAAKFTFLDKDEDAGPDSPDGLGGVVFEVLTNGDNDGTWAISWEDTNGAEPENLPLLVDLVVMLKGSNNAAIYLLSNVLLSLDPTSGLGTFDIQFLNNGGKDCETLSLKKTKTPGDNGADGKECKDNQPGLSHLTVFGRVAQSEIFQVPEPASLAMFGAGLVGLWAFRRKWARQRRH